MRPYVLGPLVCALSATAGSLIPRWNGTEPLLLPSPPINGGFRLEAFPITGATAAEGRSLGFGCHNGAKNKLVWTNSEDATLFTFNSSTGSLFGVNRAQQKLYALPTIYPNHLLTFGPTPAGSGDVPAAFLRYDFDDKGYMTYNGAGAPYPLEQQGPDGGFALCQGSGTLADVMELTFYDFAPAGPRCMPVYVKSC